MPEPTREQNLEAALHDCVRLLREANVTIKDLEPSHGKGDGYFTDQQRRLLDRIDAKLTELESLGLIEGE